MKILYFHSVWGLDDLSSVESKLTKIKAGGFDGVELDVPTDADTCRRARRCLDDLGLEVVAQQWRTTGATPQAHMDIFAGQYERALLLKPLYLNSHTGRDHFTFEQNLAIFDHAESLAKQGGMAVYHETHRSRAMFTVPATVALLTARPALKLVADFSHWCCVHETLLADQAERVEAASRRAYAIHARVGHAQGPQIADPRDPIWASHLATHLAWWQQIVALRRAEGCPVLPICPEFGPVPYTTQLPHTHEPIADLWDVNCWMREWLKRELAQT